MRRMTLKVPDSFDEVLTSFATRNQVSKPEAVRRALAVLVLVEREAKNGRSLGIVKEDSDTQELHAVGLIRGM